MKKKSKAKQKLLRVPIMTTDEEAEAFLNQDLSDYLHEGNFKPVTFEFVAKRNDKSRKQ